MRRTHHRLLRAALLATLALLTTAAMAWPAAAAPSTPTPEQWLPVTLGTHSFGHLRTPDATVITAGPDQVGFYRPPPGVDGSYGGPKPFDLPRDGSIWLSDHVKDRLLAWQPNQSTQPVRSVTLSSMHGDFAVAGDGTIYVTYSVKDQGVPGMEYHLDLAALSPTGQLRWRGHTIMDYANALLRFGPDGALYWAQAGEHVWTQLTTPAGQLLTVAEQRRQTRPGQPLAGGRRLVVTKLSEHDWRVVLVDPTGRAVRGWRITSQTELWSIDATPALVGGDPVLVLSPVRQPATGKLLWESLVLRLGPNGGTRLRFPIAPTDRVVWGDPAWSGLRVGPDGQLYQLRTDPAWGARIVRWSLQPQTPTTSPGGGAVPPSTVTAPRAATPRRRRHPHPPAHRFSNPRRPRRTDRPAGRPCPGWRHSPSPSCSPRSAAGGGTGAGTPAATDDPTQPTDHRPSPARQSAGPASRSGPGQKRLRASPTPSWPADCLPTTGFPLCVGATCSAVED